MVSGKRLNMSNLRKIQRLLKSLCLLISPRTWGPFSLAANETKFDHAFTVSWSQCAEDLVVAQALEGVKNGKYLDIGAHHPSRFSVTRKLFERGWSGVNVDANEQLLDSFRKSRPSDLHLNFAVGDLPFYELAVFKESAISTVDTNWKHRFLSEQNQLGFTVKVPGRSLRSILDEHFPIAGPDFLNIDVEGADLAVLMSGEFESLPSRRHPLLILVENQNPENPNDGGEIEKYLTSVNYCKLYVLPFSSLYKKAI